jgi:hypothetical protein
MGNLSGARRAAFTGKTRSTFRVHYMGVFQILKFSVLRKIFNLENEHQ